MIQGYCSQSAVALVLCWLLFVTDAQAERKAPPSVGLRSWSCGWLAQLERKAPAGVRSARTAHSHVVDSTPLPRPLRPYGLRSVSRGVTNMLILASARMPPAGVFPFQLRYTYIKGIRCVTSGKCYFVPPAPYTHQRNSMRDKWKVLFYSVCIRTHRS